MGQKGHTYFSVLRWCTALAQMGPLPPPHTCVCSALSLLLPGSPHLPSTSCVSAASVSYATPGPILPQGTKIWLLCFWPSDVAFWKCSLSPSPRMKGPVGWCVLYSGWMLQMSFRYSNLEEPLSEWHHNGKAIAVIIIFWKLEIIQRNAYIQV
jgi:hypothetical protein